MPNKSLSIQRLETALAKEREKCDRLQRFLDSTVKERNDFERLYTNLTFDFADLARLKISSFFKHSQEVPTLKLSDKE